ncbi:hypothetical protein ACRAWD_30440 [Caulobacter segnis]
MRSRERLGAHAVREQRPLPADRAGRRAGRDPLGLHPGRQAVGEGDRLSVGAQALHVEAGRAPRPAVSRRSC